MDACITFGIDSNQRGNMPLPAAGDFNRLKQQIHYRLALKSSGAKYAGNAPIHNTPFGNNHPVSQIYRRGYHGREDIAFRIRFCAQSVIQLQRDSSPFGETVIGSGSAWRHSIKHPNQRNRHQRTAAGSHIIIVAR
jgi:hypothetical protein